jgi:hypothetical protein
MEQTTVTLWVAVAGIFGTFGSGFMTQRMARQAEHRQWGRDKRLDECKELLSQFTVTYFALTDWGTGVTPPQNDPQGKYNNEVAELHRVMGSRILIEGELKSAEIPERVEDAMERYVRDKDLKALVAEYQRLREEIVDIGRKIA